ncbi:hypothetical protein M8998_13855 [Sphingobacterium sp. lm-10]|uniref:hypothetical protein n=1 Tax=Sphingobacterium sp. lm-10 TaxID=2944904 RepID=UPI002022640A|nr:hypothetical protein [Sphingobacterium sp. lm-10]MCL7989030.1 hypothetical protein [Sphingobacterium sp. lm-10]
MTNKNLLLLLVTISVLISACGSLNPAKQVDMLKSYNYDVESVTGLTIAGRAADGLLQGNGTSLNMNALPGLAMGILRKDLPLAAVVNMKVSNPTTNVTGINAFKYLIEIKGKPFFEGTVDRVIRLNQGESAVVPLTFNANLFGVVDENRGIEGLLSDLLTREGQGAVVLKIKPSISLGGSNIFYPGYITIDNDLLKSISKR